MRGFGAIGVADDRMGDTSRLRFQAAAGSVAGTVLLGIRMSGVVVATEAAAAVDSMAGVTASPNLATGLTAVRFFSNRALRWLKGSMAGSGESFCGEAFSNKLRFSTIDLREAVSLCSAIVAATTLFGDLGVLLTGAAAADGLRAPGVVESVTSDRNVVSAF